MRNAIHSKSLSTSRRYLSSTCCAASPPSCHSTISSSQAEPRPSPAPKRLKLTLPSLFDFTISPEEEAEFNQVTAALDAEDFASSTRRQEELRDFDQEDNIEGYADEFLEPEPISSGGGGGGDRDGSSALNDSGLAALLGADQQFLAALLSMDNSGNEGGAVAEPTESQLGSAAAGVPLPPPSSSGFISSDTDDKDLEPTTATSVSLDLPETTDGNPTENLPDIEIDFGDEPFLADPTSLNSVFDENDNDDHQDHNDDNEEPPPPFESSTRTTDNDYDDNELHRLVQNLALGDFPIDGNEDITDSDLEAETLLNELVKLSLFEDAYDGNFPDNPQQRNEARNNTAQLGQVEMGEMSQVPPGLPLFCFPCDDVDAEGGIVVGKDGTPNYVDLGKQNGVVLHDDQNNAFQPLDPTLPPITEHVPSDAVESEVVRRTKDQERAELQALYASSRRQNDLNEEGDEGLMLIDQSDPLIRRFNATLDADSTTLDEQPSWLDAADRWASGFGVHLQTTTGLDDSNIRPVSSEKMGMGHKETIFGVKFSPDGKYLATASQESTIAIWDVANHRLVAKLQGHSKAYECLRVDWASETWSDEVLDRAGRFRNLVASSGADGIVKMWASRDPLSKQIGDAPSNNENQDGWKCEFTLDHAKLLNRGISKDDAEEDDKKGNGDAKGATADAMQADDDKPQVYSLQFIDHWKVFTDQMHQTSQNIHDRQNPFLLTSSDEFIHLWEVVGHPFDQQLQLDQQKIRILQDNEIKLKEVMSLHFGNLEQRGYGVTPCSLTGAVQLPPPPLCGKHGASVQQGTAFGGERNPQNIVFIFDASYCPASGLLGVALADGSLRLVNGRGMCISILNLPGNNSHLTSLSWDCTGQRLATTVATGHLITWGLDLDSNQTDHEQTTVATCIAIYEGGHQSMRPLFGARFVGDEDEKLIISWGIDGKLCLWDSCARGNLYAPIAILKENVDYPIYAVDVSTTNVAVGGGSDGGFIGVPLYLYKIPAEQVEVNRTPRVAQRKTDDTPKD